MPFTILHLMYYSFCRINWLFSHILSRHCCFWYKKSEFLKLAWSTCLDLVLFLLHWTLTDVPFLQTYKETLEIGFSRWTFCIFHAFWVPKPNASTPPVFYFYSFLLTSVLFNLLPQFFFNMHEIIFSRSIKFRVLFSLFSSRIHYFLWPFSLHHNSSFS